MSVEKDKQSGVTVVRRVREEIAAEHAGDLAAHIAESNRIAEELRETLRLGRVVEPPIRRTPRSGTAG